MSNKQVLGRLLSFLRPFAWRVIFSILLSVATIGSSIALMMTSAWLICTAGLQLGITSLGIAPTAVRLFGLSRAVSRYLERLVSHDVTFRLLADLRVWFYERIEPLAPAGLAQYRTGDLMARIVSDVEELQNFFIRVVAPPIVAVVVMLVMTVAFLFFDVWAALVLFGFMLTAGTAIPYLAWWQGRNPARALVETRSNLHIEMVDTVQGLADSLAYGHTDAQMDVIRQLNDDIVEQEINLTYWDAVQTSLFVLLSNIAGVAILAVAIPRVEGLYLAVLVLGALAAFEAFMPLGLAAQHLNGELTAAQRLFDVLNITPPVQDSDTTNDTAPERGDIAIHNMTFRYGSHLPPVLDDFSLHIADGERVAIVGESGAGKSSLVQMLLRFREHESGSVQVGGIPLKDIHPEAVRQTFGVMSQRTHLFNTTIAENIRIANKNATHDEIITAAKRAQIHEFVMSLPDGYDTHVGENGVALSGGERQRVALARVILKNAPIWILDEATANLDAQTELAVMQSIYDAADGRTLLLITHRLPLLQDIERVIRLSESEATSISS